jgi:multicomponent Na+:H+ antiporter subunit E
VNFFSLNLVLAIIWAFLTGSFTAASFLFGLVVGYLILWVARPYLGSDRYLASVIGLFRFVRQYLKEILVANVQLARDLLRPEMPFVPGIVEFRTHGLTRAEVVVLANMISLTPGTLSMDTDDTGTVLYIHSVYAHDLVALRESFQRLAGLIHGVKHPEGMPERRVGPGGIPERRGS